MKNNEAIIRCKNQFGTTVFFLCMICFIIHLYFYPDIFIKIAFYYLYFVYFICLLKSFSKYAKLTDKGLTIFYGNLISKSELFIDWERISFIKQIMGRAIPRTPMAGSGFDSFPYLDIPLIVIALKGSNLNREVNTQAISPEYMSDHLSFSDTNKEIFLKTFPEISKDGFFSIIESFVPGKVTQKVQACRNHSTMKKDVLHVSLFLILTFCAVYTV